MTAEQSIAKAIEDIELAEAHVAQAAQAYYRARKRLEGVYSPAARKGRKQVLSIDQVAHMFALRKKSINRQKTTA